MTRVGRLWQICRKRGEMSRERRRYGGRERRRGQRRAAWGARGGAGEGAERVGGMWVREGAGRCRGSAGRRGAVQGRCRECGRRVGEGGRRAVQGKRGAAWGARGGAGEARGSAGRCRGRAGRCRGSALPHAAQAAGDGGSRTVPVRPEKEAVGDTYPLLRAVPWHQPIQETSEGGRGAASQQEPRPNVCPWGPFGRGRFEDKGRWMYFRPAQGRRKYRQGAIPRPPPGDTGGWPRPRPPLRKKIFTGNEG